MISVILCGRNDNYGGHLIERFSYSINAFLEVFEEVIYVDWNTDTDKKILIDEIEIKDKSKLKVIEIRPCKVKELLNDDKNNQKMCEVLARNIGIRRSSGDIIVSSNIDILPQKRDYLELLTKKLKIGDMITLSRNNIELDDIKKYFKPNNIDLESLPIIFGIEPISKTIMSPYVSINKEIIEKYPTNYIYQLASVVGGCGDFQIAHKETWYKIRGFEENMTKRLYNDTYTQYKVIMSGGNVTGCNFPPIYHLNHERDERVHLLNVLKTDKKTNNSENWGFINDKSIQFKE